MVVRPVCPHCYSDATLARPPKQATTSPQHTVYVCLRCQQTFDVPKLLTSQTK